MVGQLNPWSPPLTNQARGGNQQLEQSPGQDSPGKQAHTFPAKLRKPEDARKHGGDHCQVEPDLVEGGQGKTVQYVQHATEQCSQADEEHVGKEELGQCRTRIPAFLQAGNAVNQKQQGNGNHLQQEQPHAKSAEDGVQQPKSVTTSPLFERFRQNRD